MTKTKHEVGSDSILRISKNYPISNFVNTLCLAIPMSTHDYEHIQLPIFVEPVIDVNVITVEPIEPFVEDHHLENLDNVVELFQAHVIDDGRIIDPLIDELVDAMIME